MSLYTDLQDYIKARVEASRGAAVGGIEALPGDSATPVYVSYTPRVNRADREYWIEPQNETPEPLDSRQTWWLGSYTWRIEHSTHIHKPNVPDGSPGPEARNTLLRLFHAIELILPSSLKLVIRMTATSDGGDFEDDRLEEAVLVTARVREAAATA